MNTSEDSPALLFFDILGTKSVWNQGGVEGATALFSRFQRLVRDAAEPWRGDIISGSIESDSAAFLCTDAASAVSLGTDIYCGAFFKPSHEATREHRIWLRGVVGPAGDSTDVSAMRTSKPLGEDGDHITVETYADELLDAISAEKSGFKGMRLLIHSDLVTSRTQSNRKITLDESDYNLFPFRHLDHSAYPPRLVDHQDVLWMASGNDEDWQSRRSRMSTRIRFSARDGDEVIQAAATQVVFDECEAIIASLRRRRPKRVRRSPE